MESDEVEVMICGDGEMVRASPLISHLTLARFALALNKHHDHDGAENNKKAAPANNYRHTFLSSSWCIDIIAFSTQKKSSIQNKVSAE